MAKVVLESLVKTYPEKNGPGTTVVHGIDLEIHDREFMVLVGPSGCGKSTTLRMIAGLESITSGRISIDGRPVNDLPPKDRDIAMVFQNYALYPHMSVYDNLAFGLKLRRRPKPEIDARVREAASLLGLADYLHRKPAALSGGQRQRVALGRAIVRHPKVFLFDEPLSNLDAKMRVTTRAEISKLHARLDATMIYVTHDQVEAMTMGDRICVMKDGRIQQVAAPMDLYNHPANLFVAGFIGSPPMNLLRGTLRPGPTGPAFVEDSPPPATDAQSSPPPLPPLTVPLDGRLAAKAAPRLGQPVVLGLRPENILEVSTGSPSPLPAADLRLDVAEPMGAETFLHLASAAHTLVARVRPDHLHGVGRPVRVAFALDRAHLFDPATGLAL